MEIKDVFVKLEAVHLQTGNIHTFFHKDCQFGYRDSIFKREAKGKFLIAYVTLKLTKNDHKLNTSYGAIAKELEARSLEPGIHAISEVVCAIRQSKLPDPAIIGNAGSFFKNPVVSRDIFESIRQSYPEMPYYQQDDGSVKIPAGWLIQTCGWKGWKKRKLRCS